MKHRNRILVSLVVLVLAVLIGGGWWIRARAASAASSNAIEATGVIEARQAELASEIGGKVVEVLVEEGQPVETNQALVRLDDSLLMAQREVAEAGLATAQSAAQTAQLAYQSAQAQYQITLVTALAQDQKTRLKDWFSKDQKQFNQPNWYFTRVEQMQAAQTQVDKAKIALDEAIAHQTDMTKSLDTADFLLAEQRLLNARLAYLISKDVNQRAQNSTTSNDPVGLYNSTHCGTNEGYRLANARLTNQVYGCTGDDQLSAAGETLYENAQDELENAQQVYDELLTSQAATDVLQARADVSVAQERFYAALDRWHGLQTGDQSPSVTAAQSTLDQAQAAYDQSQKVVAQTQANLALLDVQIKKLTLAAPSDGVILTRNAEVGQMALPGATLIEMGRLNRLELTVYLPEEKFGLIVPGQAVQVRVDAYSDRVFEGTILRMANEAEFTPTNVQTKEDRTRLVYAVVISLDNPDLALKPGMIADVNFALGE